MIFERFHHCPYLLEGDYTTVSRCQLNKISSTCDASLLMIQLISTIQEIIGLNIGLVTVRYLTNSLCIQNFPTGHLVDQIFELGLPLLQLEWLGEISALGQGPDLFNPLAHYLGMVFRCWVDLNTQFLVKQI